jgi:hypothetical protein
MNHVRFAGGLELPRRFGRFSAPLAALWFTDAGVELGLAGPLQRLVKNRIASYEDIESAQGVKGAFFRKGVLLNVHGEVWVFWVNPGQKAVRDSTVRAILAACAEHGVTVLDGVRWTNGRS